MTSQDAQQPTLEGFASRTRSRRATAQSQAKSPSAQLPIAQVVLDVQATHLGQTFDYLIDERQSSKVRPGVLVRVRFGGRRVNGVVWRRAERSDSQASALRYIERVLGNEVLVPKQLRDDITSIARAYGGTRANIVRLAVPPRVVRVEKEQMASRAATQAASRAVGQEHLEPSHTRQELLRTRDRAYERMQRRYEHIDLLHDALSTESFQSFVLDVAPGVSAWCRDAAWLVLAALCAGRSSVTVLPTAVEIDDLVRVLRSAGLRVLAPPSSPDGVQLKPDETKHVDGEHSSEGETGNSADGSTGSVDGSTDGSNVGQIAILSAAMSPAERYRSYLAITTGQVSCVIGTRAAMYAPVQGPAVFSVLDDGVYQYADGMMPYANARGVLRLRARCHDGVFVALSYATSAISQMETTLENKSEPQDADALVSGPSTAIRPRDETVKQEIPWIRWLSREELARLADPSAGARVPHTAVSVLSKAMAHGPVLLSIPSDGSTDALCCTSCHHQARCLRCSGPLALETADRHTAHCQWCGAAAVNWKCSHCGATSMRVLRVGATGTEEQLRGLFRHAKVITSSPHQPQGVVRAVRAAPGMLVIATAGAEPRVVNADGHLGSYAAVAILDAWTSLYAPGVDARIDVLRTWMRVCSYAMPGAQGGQALLIGQTDPQIAQSLMMWNPSLLAAAELSDREETALPPHVAAACVWGRRDSVVMLLTRIGALDGDLAMVNTAVGDVPAVLGPVSIPQPDTVDARELEFTHDRVKAVVRVARGDRDVLVERLHANVARHVASREPGELRFQVDPKDLI